MARGRTRALICAPLLLAAAPLLAEPGMVARAEIDYLLAFIRQSSCGFVRNGRQYDAERAYRHVLRKFNYFLERIDSAEDFIELSASRSTVSGQPYQFVCDGRSRESADVLLDALARHRDGAAR